MRREFGKTPRPIGWEAEMAAGTRSLHEAPAELSFDQATAGRRRALTERTGASLSTIGDYSSMLALARCENVIGAVQIPLGVVGPLCLQGAHVDAAEELFVPLATTEGALVASTARGCRALRDAGGAVVHAEDMGITRAPVFRTDGVRQTRRFLDWVADHYQEIRAACEATSSHLRLIEITPQCVGTTVFLRFRFLCGDAMGMNMATIACARAVDDLIVPQSGVTCVSISGNYCVDKKPAALNFIEGRGKRISAEVVLTHEILETCLKTDAARLCELQYRKNLLGSIMAGSLGFNAHYANIVAAFFMATGQDIAQVAEGALGVTCVEARGAAGVYVSVFLPDVPVAALGGGTMLDTQREALDLLGVRVHPSRPGAAAMRLAEILGAVVLAGELSTLCALSAHHLAGAHERLGRPVHANGPAHS